MLLALLIGATFAQDAQRIERPIMADRVPLEVATKGLVQDAPRLESDVRELLMCDADGEVRPRLCRSVANLDRWEDQERKEEQLMEEAVDQANSQDDNLPWR
jgi:hypothetical protein